MTETPTRPADDLSPADRNRSLAAALACVAAVGLGIGATLPLLALRMEAMGASASMIGLNTAMVGLAHVIVSPLVPAILRRVPMLPFLAGTILFAAACVLLFPLTDNLLVWFPIRFAMSSALAALFMTSEIWINSIAQAETRGRVMGLYSTVFAGAFAVGPATLMVVGTTGMAPFAVTSGMIFFALFALASGRSVLPAVDGKPSRHILGFIAAAPAAILAALAYGAIETQVFNLLPVYAVRSGETEASAAFFLTVFALGNVALQIPIGLLADRMNRRLLLALCAVIGAIGPALLPWLMGQPLMLFPILFVYGGVIVGLYTVGLTMLGEYFTGPDLVSANAAFVLTYSTGLLAGPALGGMAMDAINPDGLILTLAGVPALYAAIAMWRYATRSPKPHGDRNT